jgi:hypothetical protein
MLSTSKKPGAWTAIFALATLLARSRSFVTPPLPKKVTLQSKSARLFDRFVR